MLPFRELLKDTVPWLWDEEIDRVFMETKADLANKVEEGIKSFDPNLVTALLTDWCKHGVGFVLLQKHCSCPDKMDGSTNTLCCATG